MARAARATKTYTIEGTPSLVVDGRYLTSGSMAPSIKGMVPVLEELVRLARDRRGSK
jgi:thiol:disulfide interchange protein DsbA